MMRGLRTHLTMLRRRGLITEWLDRDIEAGAEWRDEIAEALEAADLILLFVSADFLDSDFCYEQEMTRALERSDEGTTRVIPVLLRPVDGWEDSPFARLQITPRGGRPISVWPNQDEAFADVASKIRRVVERLREEPEPARVDRGGDTRLAALTSQLRSALDNVRAAREDVLIAELGPYFAQFLIEDGGVWCEVVSNEFLEPPLALDDEQQAALSRLGWRRPEENLPNWWWAAPLQTSTAEIAGLVVATLAEAYRVDSAASFAFEHFSNEG